MSTAQDLLDAGATYRSPAQRLRDAVADTLHAAREEGLPREEALQALVPHTLLDTSVLEDITTSILSGSHLLVLGPPGSGKTQLARDLWRLVPKEVTAVEGCPVQDDPLSVVDAHVAEMVPPCPVCRDRFDPSTTRGFDADAVDAADVPVVRTILREGHGFARVQGSPEVFPDHLTGNVNLARLEEVGDPASPLVLEPGKLLQANRGMLLVDEVGKLPRGTQNALLQALQEHQVSPARSRETFPASFVAVATSNLRDLGNLSEALNDRLVNVHVDFNQSHRANVEIVERHLDGHPVAAPRLVRHAAARLVETWRATDAGVGDLAEVGSNRAMVDVVQRARAEALMEGRHRATLEDLRAGSQDALASRVRARGGASFQENRRHVHRFVEEHLDDVLAWAGKRTWCVFQDHHLEGDEDRGRDVLSTLETGGHADAWNAFVAEAEGDAADPGTAFTELRQVGAFEDA